MGSKAKNIGLLFIAISVIFFAGELIINIVDGIIPRRSNASSMEDIDFRGWQPDPILNRVHIPGLKFDYIVRDEERLKIPIEYNSKGLNDYEYDYQKPEDTARILVFGDSFVEALQVRREENFCKRLEQGLNQNKQQRRYQVINMGVSGYSPILEYLYLKREGLKYDPDIIVLCFFMNDVYEDSVYKGMATFDNNNLPISVHWRGFDKMEKLKGPKLLERRFCESFKNILNKSKFYVFLKKRFYRLLTVLKVKNMPLDKNPFFILTGNPKKHEAALWADTFRYILATKKLAEATQAKFLFVAVPIESQLSDNPEDSAFRTYFREKPNSERSQAYMSSFCKEDNINYISLLDEFRKESTGDLYFTGDGHFNANGHEKVARIISEKLKTLGWIK